MTAPANILAVDDRVENLTALTAVLEPLGQRVVTARSGEEALQCLLRDRFAVILMDVRMPVMSGFETANYVRQREKTRHIPIIFLTAASDDADHVFRGYRAGAVDYIVKPFDPDVLRSKVAVFVELHQMQVEIERQADLLREQELQELARENEARYRFLAEAIPQHVWEATATGEVVYRSQRMIDELEEVDAEVAPFLPFTRQDHDACMKRWKDALRSGQPLQIEAQLRGRDGELRWYLVQASPYPAADGTIARWVGSNSDIDDRKRRELERAALFEVEREARESAEERERRAQFLSRLTAELEEESELASRLERLMALCVPELADFATVESIRSDGRIEVLASAVRDAADEAALRSLRVGQDHVDVPISTAKVLATDEVLLARDLEPLGDASSDRLWVRLNPSCCLGVRIEAGSAPPLAVLLWRSADSEPFTDHDAELAAELAERIRPVLENARLYDEQSRIFRVLQRSLLSGVGHSLPGVTFTVRYEAATDGLEIGGDWYDLFELPGERLAFAVGDVVGHGLAAASTMAKLRSAVRALAMIQDDPADLLLDLDRYVELTDDAHCTTLFFGVLEPAQGRLRYACAGHPPPLVVDRDGTSRFLPDGRSAPLGVLGATRTAAEQAMPAGSTIIVYSDGLIERRGESLDDGLARLESAAASAPGLGVEELADCLMDVTESGTGRGDDAALLCLRLEADKDAVLLRRFPADAGELRLLREHITTFLTSAGLREPELGDAVLACNEACANAIEHAYASPGEGDVALELRVHDDRLDIAVRDFGSWRRTSAGTGGGRGMALMRALTDDISVVTNERGTMVRMRKRRSLEPATS